MLLYAYVLPCYFPAYLASGQAAVDRPPSAGNKCRIRRQEKHAITAATSAAVAMRPSGVLCRHVVPRRRLVLRPCQRRVRIPGQYRIHPHSVRRHFQTPGTGKGRHRSFRRRIDGSGDNAVHRRIGRHHNHRASRAAQALALPPDRHISCRRH